MTKYEARELQLLEQGHELYFYKWVAYTYIKINYATLIHRQWSDSRPMSFFSLKLAGLFTFGYIATQFRKAFPLLCAR